MRYITLEYIRGFAAIGVAIGHYYALCDDSRPVFELISVLFVELFFPLSGFVLANQLLSLLENSRNIIVFLLRRWMRTLIPFFIALFIAGNLGQNLISLDTIHYLTFLSNIKPNVIENPYYSISWSLAIEEWFYLFFPICLLYLFGLQKKLTCCNTLMLKDYFPGLSGFFAIFLILKLYAVYHFDPQFMRTCTWCRLDSIAFGFSCYLLVKYNKLNITYVKVCLLLSVIVLIPICINTSCLTKTSSLFFVYSTCIFASSLILLLFYLEVKKIFIMGKLVSAIGLLLGRMSYPIYLFHVIALTILPKPSNVFNLFVYVVVLFVFSWLFNVFVEQPILEMRPDYTIAKNGVLKLQTN